MGDTPVGEGWVAPGDVVVVAPKAPYQDLPLSESERPGSAPPKVVLEKGVELRVEEVRGRRARVRSLGGASEAVEGWVRLCAADGTPFVQPLWLARQEEGGRPGSAAAAAGAAGTEEELAELLRSHGVSTDDCGPALSALGGRLRRREAVLEPSEDGGVVLHADCMLLQVVAGDRLLVETHRETAATGAVATAGGLPRRWRIAGESWADCAKRALREALGLSHEQIEELCSFEDLPEPSAGPPAEPPLPGLRVEGERRRVVCRLAPALPAQLGAGAPFVTCGRGGDAESLAAGAEGEVQQYWAWWSAALWRTVEEGRMAAKGGNFGQRAPGLEGLAEGQALAEEVLWVARGLLGEAEAYDIRELSPGPPTASGAAAPLLLLGVAWRCGRPEVPQLLRVDVAGEALLRNSSRTAAEEFIRALGDAAAQPVGEPLVHSGGRCSGQRLELRGAAWQVPELAEGGVGLVSSLRTVLLEATLPNGGGGVAAEVASFAGSLAADLAPHCLRLGACLGGLAARGGHRRCAEDLLDIYEGIFEDGAFPQAAGAVRRLLREEPGRAAPAQWRPLAAPRHGALDAASVAVDALGSSWVVPCSAQADCSRPSPASPSSPSSAGGPLLADLGHLSACLLLEGVALPVAAEDLASEAPGLAASDLSRWLGLAPAVARRLLEEARAPAFAAGLGEALARAASQAGAPGREAEALRRLRALVLPSREEAAGAARQAARLGEALASRLPRWGELPPAGEGTEEGEEPGTSGAAPPPAPGTWAGAAWEAQASLLRAGAASLSGTLHAARQAGAQAKVDTSALLLLLPMLRAAQLCARRAAPWQRPWAESYGELLAAQVGVAANRAWAALGPQWSPLWLRGSTTSKKQPSAVGGVAFAEGMRLRVLERPAPQPSDASDDPNVDVGAIQTCGGERREEVDERSEVLHGWPCAVDGVSFEQGWQLWEQVASSAGTSLPSDAPPEVLKDWAEAAQPLPRSCTFRRIMAVTAGEGCPYTIEELPPPRRAEKAAPAGVGASELVLQGCRVGIARLREEGGGCLRVRIEQRTICSPPCQAGSLQHEEVEVDLGTGRTTKLRVELSSPFFWYPAGSRIVVTPPLGSSRPPTLSGSLTMGERLRECTVLRLLEGQEYEVRFDGEAQKSSTPSRVRVGLGNHRPAGVFRYAVGQRLMFHDGSGWSDVVVERTGNGNCHLLAKASPAQNGGSASVWADLNTANHSPAWLTTHEFECALRAYGRRLLAQCASLHAPLGGPPLDVMAQPMHLCRVRGSGRTGALCASAKDSSAEDEAWPWLHDELLRPSARARHQGTHSAPSFAVAGAPLAGKSLLLRRLAALSVRTGSEFLPVLISGERLGREMEADPSLSGDLALAFLERSSAELVVPVAEGPAQSWLLRQALHARRCLLLVDDVDAAGRMAKRVLAHLARLVQAGHRVVYTHGGPPPKPGAARRPFEHLELRPLDEPRQRRLAEQRLSMEAAAELVAGVGKIAAGDAAMLQLLVAAAEPRGGRPFEGATEAYGAVVSAALARAGIPGGRRLLERLALEAHRRKASVLKELEVRAYLGREELKAWEALKAATSAGLMPLLRGGAGPQAAGESESMGANFQFAHLSLQEHLFATRAASLLEAGAAAELPALRTLLAEAWWARALEFLAEGFTPQCRTLLRRGLAAWESRRGPVEASALHLAAERGLPGVLRLLLEEGQAPGGVQHRSRHIYGSLEETPLCCAAGRGLSEVVELLVTKNAELGGFQSVQVSPGGERRERTPLFGAVEAGHLAVVRLLLQHGAPVDGVQHREAAATAAPAAAGPGGRGPRGRSCADAAGSEEMRLLLRRAEAR